MLLTSKKIGKYIYETHKETVNDTELFVVRMSLAIAPTKYISEMKASTKENAALALIYMRMKHDKNAKF